MIDIVSETIKKVQRISAALRPGMLDDLGLIPAVQWYGQEFEERTGLKCNFDLKELPSHNSQINLTLFRIFQEGLTNIIRHADAKSVDVKLYSSLGNIILKITDDGIGTEQEKINTIEKQFRGFDNAMVETGYRYQELYWAGQDENWEYADYQLEKIAIERKKDYEAQLSFGNPDYLIVKNKLTKEAIDRLAELHRKRETIEEQIIKTAMNKYNNENLDGKELVAQAELIAKVLEVGPKLAGQDFKAANFPNAFQERLAKLHEKRKPLKKKFKWP